MNIRIIDTKQNIDKLSSILKDFNYEYKIYNNRDKKQQRLYINIDSDKTTFKKMIKALNTIGNKEDD